MASNGNGKAHDDTPETQRGDTERPPHWEQPTDPIILRVIARVEYACESMDAMREFIREERAQRREDTDRILSGHDRMLGSLALLRERVDSLEMADGQLAADVSKANKRVERVESETDATGRQHVAAVLRRVQSLDEAEAEKYRREAEVILERARLAVVRERSDIDVATEKRRALIRTAARVAWYAAPVVAGVVGWLLKGC